MPKFSDLIRGLREWKCGEINKSALRRIIFSSNSSARGKFKKQFGPEVNMFIEETFKAYKAYKAIDDICSGDKRKSYVAGFLFSALNNLVSSFHLLISGFLVPSGNLMRQYFEAASVAILLSKKELRFFERLEKEGRKFPSHKALGYVGRHLSKFNIRRNNWNEFERLYKFFDPHSHASPFSLAAACIDFSLIGNMFLGSGYDPEKRRIYKKDIDMRISAAKCLENIAKGIMEGLN